MAGADFRSYIAEKTGQTKQSNMQNQLGIANKPPKLLTIDASVARPNEVTVQVDEGVNWTKMSNDCEASCSKATTGQSNSEHESESEDSSDSAESNEDSVQVQMTFMAKTVEVHSEGSPDAASVASDTSETLSFECNNCALLEAKLEKLKAHNVDLVNELTNLKDA